MAIIVEKEYTHHYLDSFMEQYNEALKMMRRKDLHEITLHYWDGKASVLGEVIRLLEGKRIIRGRDS